MKLIVVGDGNRLQVVWSDAFYDGGVGQRRTFLPRT